MKRKESKKDLELRAAVKHAQEVSKRYNDFWKRNGIETEGSGHAKPKISRIIYNSIIKEDSIIKETKSWPILFAICINY